jgi:hypothetical protein
MTHENQWVPRPGEKVALEGRGHRSDFFSVQTVTETSPTDACTTGGWRFVIADGEWRWSTKGPDIVVMKRQPHLNQDMDGGNEP